MKCQVPTASFPHYVPRPPPPSWPGAEKHLLPRGIARRMKVRTIKQLAVLALIIAPMGLGGQDFSGPLVAAGQLRLEINSLFLFADERFGRRMEGGSFVEEDEPLGFDFADTAVGSRLFPALEDLEADLTTAAGAAITPLVLGRTRAVLTKDAVWLPIRLDVGRFRLAHRWNHGSVLATPRGVRDLHPNRRSQRGRPAGHCRRLPRRGLYSERRSFGNSHDVVHIEPVESGVLTSHEPFG